MDNLNLILAGFISFLVIALKSIPDKLFKIFKRKVTSSIFVMSTDIYIFQAVNNWLLNKKNKSLKHNMSMCAASREAIESVWHSFNYGLYLMIYKKTLVIIIKDKIDKATFDRVIDSVEVIIFGLKRKEVFNEIVEFIHDKSNNSMTKVMSTNSNYYFHYVLPKTFDNIWMRDKDKFLTILNIWKNNRNMYMSNGIVYKLGILLYGPPGTGKTSVVRAIANWYDAKIRIINFKTFKDENQFVESMVTLPGKTVFVFEDIDIIFQKREDNNNDDISLSTLLNILDGIMSLNNCIYVATTNHIERLDKALIRPGRFDVSIKMDIIKTKKDLKDFCEIMGRSMYDIKLPVVPSKLQSLLLGENNG